MVQQTVAQVAVAEAATENLAEENKKLADQASRPASLCLTTVPHGWSRSMLYDVLA